MTHSLNKHPYDLTVYIGRFSPFHIGHEQVLHDAFANSNAVLVLIGSVNKPRTFKNPWNYDERRKMIVAWKDRAVHNVFVKDKPFIVLPLRDELYNDQLWIQNVQTAVKHTCHTLGLDPKTARIALTGSKRDLSTYYLDLFPTWEKRFVEAVLDPRYNETGKPVSDISATLVRDIYFTKDLGLDLDGELAPGTTLDFLREFRRTEIFEDLKREYEFHVAYKKAWEVAPYAPTFVTVDSVVVQSGHVLLIKRRSEPGKGLWAIPGGFVNQDEKLIDSALRELREETGLKVPEQVLRGSIVEREVFDAPERSTRGRTITHAFLFKLKDSLELPHIKGSSDAEKAQWFPISEIADMEESLFEDHHAIIVSMIRKLKE
jgi:bifunctional NMN adenylyltransferase/nudix hydrolase